MAKYSFEFKKKVVNSYLNGEGSFEFVAKKYEIPTCTNVKTWVRNYKNFGDEGLFRSRKNELYSFEYKLHVVELYLSNVFFRPFLCGLNASGPAARKRLTQFAIILGVVIPSCSAKS